MQWTIGISVPRRYENDYERFSLRPFTIRQESIYHSVRGQFKLKEPFAHYGFQTDGYIGWGVRGGSYFKGTVLQYLRAFGFMEESLNNRLYILDPLNMFSYGWYIEEPYPRGQAGAHILGGALKSSSFMSNPYGRGVDVCFNHDRRDDPTYFPPPASAFFEDANSFIYTGNPNDPRITCPALIRSDWWERLRFYIRIFDTVYILKPTEYARRCYYRLIEDELPAKLSAILTPDFYPRKPLRNAAWEIFGSDFPSEVKGYGFGINARVAFTYVAPSFAQGEIKDPYAPYPVTGLLSPTPPFVSEIPSLIDTAVGKEMSYSPYTPGPCMYPGTYYHGNFTSIDGWGVVPAIASMSEFEFESWRQGIRERGGGGITLFQIHPDGDVFYIRTGQPFLIWGGTSGDYILLEPFQTDSEMDSITKVKVLKEGWFTTAGGVRFYSIYFIQVTVTLQTTTYHLGDVNVYEPPEPEKMEEIFFPYFTVERVHKLMEGTKRKLMLKPKCSFVRLSKINFTETLNEMINPNAKEFVAVDFGTAYPEMNEIWWQCSNVNVWHLGGAQLPVEWYSDKISAYYAQKEMEDPTANRRFFVNLIGPFMDSVARKFLAPRISGPNNKLEEIVAKYAPERVALTGWKAFDVTHKSPRTIPWTMTSSGNIYTIEDKAKILGMYQVYSKIPILPKNVNGLEIARKLLSQLPPFEYPEPLPDGYVPLPLPSPAVLGVSERAEDVGADEGAVVIIGLWTAGSWATLQPDKNTLRQQGYIIDGLGAFVPISLPMLYRDPSEPRRDTKIYPNKLCFVGSCVEPPEIQVIPSWFIWSGGILLHRRNPDNPSQALEPVQEKAEGVARKIHLVNSAKWRLINFPDDWETFEKILPFLSFVHLPIVESGRSLVEWEIVGGEKKLKLANYVQPLIVADIKTLPPVETAGFEGAFAACTNASSISAALATQREHLPQPFQQALPLSQISEVVRDIAGTISSVEQIGGLRVIPPHNIMASLPQPVNISNQAAPYFMHYNTAIPPFLYYETKVPDFRERDVDTDIIYPPHFARLCVVPHPYHNERLWDGSGFYADLRRTLLEIASVIPVTLPMGESPQEVVVDRVIPDPLLFYRRIGRECIGKNVSFWEKCSLVVGNGQIAIFAYLQDDKPIFSGYTVSGGFHRNIRRRDYEGILFAALFLAPWASQLVQNITNLAAGREIFNERSSLWQRYVINMNPYHTWLGLELLTVPVITFWGKSVSGRDMTADFAAHKGKEVQLAWGDNEQPPIGDKGWQFVFGYRQNLALIAHLGVPPLPSDFFEVEGNLEGVRDYGAFWRKRFKNHNFVGDLFTWVVPPLGWLGCVGIPGVSRLGIDPILPAENKRFREERVEYAYGNKERLLNYWDEEIRLDGQYAKKEYYLELPREDELVIPEDERLYSDDKEIRDGGEFEGRRLITLCGVSRRQKQRIYWSFRSYFDIKRTRVKVEGDILSPEEVRLGVEITRNAVLHQWVSGRPRYYLLPLFPVQWWGIPIAFSWGNNFPFWRDIIPNDYGSITFSLSVAYPFPFGRIKERLKDFVKSIPEDEKRRQVLHRTCATMGWISPQQKLLLKDLINSIPDRFLVGQPWYAPFAAYYITEQPLLPFRRLDRTYGYALADDFIRRYRDRLLHVNLAPTVFPEWYASQRFMRALGKLNWNRFINGAGRRYPVCIVAQRSPFITGGVTYNEDWDMMFYFSSLHVPDPIMEPMLPEEIFGEEMWVESLLTPAAAKVPTYINETFRKGHISKPMNNLVDTSYSAIFANNFVVPFALVPHQTYPFTIPPFIMKNWGLYAVPYWLRDVLTEVSDGFICDAEDLIYCDLLREDFEVKPRIELNTEWNPTLVRFRDCAMPNQTIGLNTWGGYAYLHRIVLPPTPVIVHSSFNFGLAEHKGIREKEDEKTFQLVEPKLTKVPYIPCNQLFTRSYFYGMRLRAFSPEDPPPLRDLLFSSIREQDGLKQAWATLLPIRFYYNHIRNRFDTDREDLENNPFVVEERGESPLSFYARLMAGLPSFIFACRNWRLPYEIIDISFSDKGEVFLILRGNTAPRYWWVNLYSPQQMQGTRFSALTNMEYLVRCYFPIRLGKVSKSHWLFSVTSETKLIKMFSHAIAPVMRSQNRSIYLEILKKKGFIRPHEISLIPLPLQIVDLRVGANEPTPYTTTYQWGEGWKKHFKEALSFADKLVSPVISRLPQPFLVSKMLGKFLATASEEEEAAILFQSPLAVLAKIFLDEINNTMPRSG